MKIVDRSGECRQVLPGEWPGACSAVSVVQATLNPRRDAGSSFAPDGGVVGRDGPRVQAGRPAAES